MSKTIHDVRKFWEENPLWSGESGHPAGSKEYFEEHSAVMIADCFAGKLDERLFPDKDHKKKVLDLGCGPGFWVIELARRNCDEIYAADLTWNAIQLARRRCEYFGVSNVNFSQQNAESLTFKDATFSHVNCQGVIHHTPHTEKAVAEIARILEPGGTATISVYYQNVFLRKWKYFKSAAKVVSVFGGGLRGRGREDIYINGNIDEIVRLYDGDENPIGKAYTQKQFVDMVNKSFAIESIFFHFFPARTLPIPIPRFLHRFLDKHAGFMLFAKLKKRDTK